MIVEGDAADLGLVLLGHVALDLVEEQARGPQPAADQLRIAGHVDEREHQRRDADVLQRRGDRRVVVIEGQAGVRIAPVGRCGCRHEWCPIQSGVLQAGSRGDNVPTVQQ